MLLPTRKHLTTLQPQTVTHRRTRFESLESRLCLSGCSISGTVYDARFDPPPDVDYQPLAGVHLFVDVNENDVFDADMDPWTISDGNGDYLFEGLEPASYPAEYTVYEMVPEGYTLTTPAVGYHAVTFNQRRRKGVWSRLENVVSREATPYLFPPSRGRRVGSQTQGSRPGTFPGRLLS